MTTPEQRLVELGITLPEVRSPAGAYVPAVRTGNLVYLSGAGPLGADGEMVIGKVGTDVDLERAQHGVVTADEEASPSSAVIPGDASGLDWADASQLAVQRSVTSPGINAAGGAASPAANSVLPFDISVEIELIAEVRGG